MPATDPRELARTLFRTTARELAIPMLPAAFFVALFEKLSLGDVLRTTAIAAAGGLLVTLGLAALLVPGQLNDALERKAADAPGQRLQRLLELARRVELRGIVSFAAGLLVVAAYVGVHAGAPAWHALPAILLGYACVSMLNLRLWIAHQDVLDPALAEEFALYPLVRPVHSKWVQPRTTGLLMNAIVATIVSLGTAYYTVGTRLESVQDNLLREKLAAAGQDALYAQLQDAVSGPRTESHVLFVIAALAAASVALVTMLGIGRRSARGAKDLGEAIDSLSSGSPRLPNFVGTDELGELSFGVATVLERLKQMALLLRQGALQLASSAEQLSSSTARQNETLSRQAAALQETEVTAQEIKQTSLLASQKTEGVLQMAERAEEISKNGETAVEQSLQGLADIRDSVGDMASRIRALGERARQIATITTAVKDLADQSNMLALNAAIEAVRSGEHGKGFSVVAREIRTLADQSIQATNRVREILQDVSDAIRDTVSITEKGSEKVQTSLVQVQSSGESLKALGAIVRDNTAAVRQIAAAVGQQNAGIGEIFEAVKDLSRMMDETLQRVQSSEEAANLVRGVAGEVSAVVRQYGAEGAEAAAEAARAA